METKFKVGDRVEVLKYAEYKGLTGTVTGYEKEEPARAIIRPDNGKWKEVYFFDEYLFPIDSPIPVFKVGDRVKIIGTRTEAPSWDKCACHNSLKFNGKAAQVRSVNNANAYIYCQMEDGVGYSFYADELELIESHITSPQPQQNQTNKPKEEQDMKPYAVIYNNLTGGAACIHGQYTTEAEAKEAAESLVAGWRANLSTKQFFTVTILNTKTGELVGSVTDAPPVVDWNAKK